MIHWHSQTCIYFLTFLRLFRFLFVRFLVLLDLLFPPDDVFCFFPLVERLNGAGSTAAMSAASPAAASTAGSSGTPPTLNRCVCVFSQKSGDFSANPSS